MCGATGKWTYFNAINLLNDANLYATYTGNTAGTSVNIAQVPSLTAGVASNQAPTWPMLVL